MNLEFIPQQITPKQAQGLIKQGATLVDDFANQCAELYMVRNPKLRFLPPDQRPKAKTSYEEVWFHYPWRQTIVRLLNQNDFFELRTARNRNLITKAEQEKIRRQKIGVIGLSVGSSIASALALEGFENFYLADGDVLGLSNLNRIRATVLDLGRNKCVIAARQITELNPYATVQIFQNGIPDEKSLQSFVKNLDIVVDEMDDVSMKIKLRLLLQQVKKPVVSAADNGDGAVADIERFDLEPKRPIYHGLLKNFPYDKIESLSFAEKFELINTIVGIDYVVPRMKASLLEVGKTLYSWPQLGGAAQLSGAVIAYLIKSIVIGEKIPSGKYDVNLDRIFLANFDSPANQKHRQSETKKFLEDQRGLFKPKS